MFKKINREEITFVTRQNDDGSERLSAIYQKKEVAYASYEVRSKHELYLKWLETNENFQSQGIGSLLVDRICSLAQAQSSSLEINVVDEEVLNGFYLKWFKKKFDPQDKNREIVIDKFNQITIEGATHPVIKFKPEDFSWSPSVGLKHT